MKNLGTIKTKTVKEVGYQMTEWYDITKYEMEYTGTFDAQKIADALTGKNKPNYNAFGGYTTVQNVTDLGNGKFGFATYYHIGP